MLIRKGLFGVVLAFSGLALYQKVSDSLVSSSAVDMHGKRALVFGGTKGIGLGFAKHMAQRGAAVTIVGRSMENGRKVVDELNALSTGNDFIQADVSLISSARNVVRDYLKNEESLDYLILSQGIATFEGRQETSEGIDLKLALHYYSRVAISLEAGEALSKTGGVALFVLSGGVHSAYTEGLRDGDWGLKNSYSLGNAANAAGFYTDLAIEQLSEKFPKVRFVHAAPGFVASNWGEDLVLPIRWLIRGLQAVAGTSIEKCADKLSPVVFEAKEPGWFLSSQNGQLVDPLPEQKDEQIRKLVWDHTLKEIHQ